MAFDYKKILKAYIRHIGNMEGIDYITHYREDLKEVGLTDEEITELENIDNIAVRELDSPSN